MITKKVVSHGREKGRLYCRGEEGRFDPLCFTCRDTAKHATASTGSGAS